MFVGCQMSYRKLNSNRFVSRRDERVRYHVRSFIGAVSLSMLADKSCGGIALGIRPAFSFLFSKVISLFDS